MERHEIEEVVAAIRGGVEAVGEAETVIASVCDMLHHTHAFAVSTTYGSTNETVRRGLHMLAEVDHEAELTLRRLRASATAAKRYLETVG